MLQICPYGESFIWVFLLNVDCMLFSRACCLHRCDIITYTPIWVKTKHFVDETSPELKRAIKWIIKKVMMANNYWLILKKFRSTELMEASENIGIAGQLPVGRQQTLPVIVWRPKSGLRLKQKAVSSWGFYCRLDSFSAVNARMRWFSNGLFCFALYNEIEQAQCWLAFCQFL